MKYMSDTTGILNQAPDVYEYKPEPMLHKELVQGLTRWERFIHERSVDFEFEPSELVFFMHDNKVYGRHITSRFIPCDGSEYHYNIMNIGTFTKKQLFKTKEEILLKTKGVITIRCMANDWVYYEGKPRRVVMIYGNETVGLENDGYFDEERIEYIKPIPLTSEILEKNGFKESGVNGFYTKHRFGCSIKIGYPRFMVSDGLTEEWVCARYVHELQQMFRLCLMDDDFADNFQV